MERERECVCVCLLKLVCVCMWMLCRIVVLERKKDADDCELAVMDLIGYLPISLSPKKKKKSL